MQVALYQEKTSSSSLIIGKTENIFHRYLMQCAIKQWAGEDLCWYSFDPLEMQIDLIPVLTWKMSLAIRWTKELVHDWFK